MPHVYPAPIPTIDGAGVLTISRFLNSPALVQRRLRTISEQRFLADAILTGRYETSGGAILYEQTEGLYTAQAPEAVNAGAEYPRTTAAPGPAAIAAVTKWGSDVPVTDEHVKRYGRRAVDIALLKITNYLVRQVDATAMTLINGAVTLTQAALAGWTAAGRDVVLDILLAAAQINAQDQGYTADTVITTDEGYARIISDSRIVSGLSTQTGATYQQVLAEVLPGMTVMPTNHLPSLANRAFVIDRSMLGGLAYERLESPEYSGDPANGVESWTRRDPAANDQWLIRGRRPVVPVIQEPNAIVAITGTLLA